MKMRTDCRVLAIFVVASVAAGGARAQDSPPSSPQAPGRGWPASEPRPSPQGPAVWGRGGMAGSGAGSPLSPGYGMPAGSGTPMGVPIANPAGNPMGVPGSPGSGLAPDGTPATDFGAPVPSGGPAGATGGDDDGLASAPGLGGGLGTSGSALNMVGDRTPITLRPAATNSTSQTVPPPFPPTPPPKTPSPQQASQLVASVRGIKISENQSPRPQDRVFYSFNFYNNLNRDVNQRFEVPLSNIRVYRSIFGLEKTFDQGNGSVGFRVPLNTVTADSTLRGNFNRAGGTSTALGDLSVYAKYILKQDPATGSLISAGLAITPPTGPGNFAGANYLSGAIHNTTFQSFAGYIWSRDRFYIQGFSALEFPVDPRDVTILYNDIGVGYFLYRATSRDQFLTAVVPTFEAHINTPLNHRDVFNRNDPAGTADSVNLTYGIHFQLGQRSLLTLAMVTPVTGPQPFQYEAAALLNIFFGAPRRIIPPTPPPVISG